MTFFNKNLEKSSILPWFYRYFLFILRPDPSFFYTDPTKTHVSDRIQIHNPTQIKKQPSAFIAKLINSRDKICPMETYNRW